MWLRRKTVETVIEDLARLGSELDESADIAALRGDFKLAEERRAAATAYMHSSSMVDGRLFGVRP